MFYKIHVVKHANIYQIFGSKITVQVPRSFHLHDLAVLVLQWTTVEMNLNFLMSPTTPTKFKLLRPLMKCWSQPSCGICVAIKTTMHAGFRGANPLNYYLSKPLSAFGSVAFQIWQDLKKNAGGAQWDITTFPSKLIYQGHFQHMEVLLFKFDRIPIFHWWSTMRHHTTFPSASFPCYSTLLHFLLNKGLISSE